MKENMRFSDGTTLTAQITVSGSLCTITDASGLLPADTSLIELYTDQGQVYGRISGYTTIYSVTGDGVILSNDSSIYTEPVLEELYVLTLAQLQAAKKVEVSAACEQIITAAMEHTTLHTATA